MELTRRQLLKIAATSTFAFSARDLVRLGEVLANAVSPPVIWLRRRAG